VNHTNLFRYKLTIEYDGTPFVGWQIQLNGFSVQAAIRDAIEGFCGEAIIPHGAGRTDAGVHATAQIAHIDLTREFPVHTIRNAINQHLKPFPIAILHVEAVSSEFDARFSARKRHYRYHIINRRAPLTLLRKRAWLVHVDLDADAMHEAGLALLGKHDFTAFRSVNCQARTPVKTLASLNVERQGESIFITTSARSFMHNQVRSIVGSLKMVGEGKWPVTQLRHVLESKDRTSCGPVAPAHGLYFSRIDYQ
jgi:tRNA pseudouridine38-40 synthase